MGTLDCWDYDWDTQYEYNNDFDGPDTFDLRLEGAPIDNAVSDIPNNAGWAQGAASVTEGDNAADEAAARLKYQIASIKYDSIRSYANNQKALAETFAEDCSDGCDDYYDYIDNVWIPYLESLEE
jgi:hypothetical protein